MKFLCHLFFAVCAFALAACSSAPYMLLNAPAKPTPLDSNAFVLVVNATEIPVIPQENTYLGTVETSGSGNCVENSADELKNAARSVGANLVYIKDVFVPSSRFSSGLIESVQCKRARADLLKVELGDFKQAPMDIDSSGLESVIKIRDELLDAYRRGDTAEVSQKIAELDGLPPNSVHGIHDAEKFGIYHELKMYRAMLQLLIKTFKNAYDPLNFQDVVYAGNDSLMAQTKEYINKVASQTLYGEMVKDIANSDLDDSEMREMMLLLHLPLTYWNRKALDETKYFAYEFVQKDAAHPDAEWVQKSILEPLNRANFKELFEKDRTENKETKIENKLYTGGFGVNVYFLGGGFGYDGYYREDMVKPESYPINAEIYLQIKRFSISGELINSALKGVMNLGFSFGYVVYDSRNLKIRPYVGFSGCIFNGSTTNPFYDSTHDDYDHSTYYGYPAGESYESPDRNTAFTLGVNVDYKFGTAYLFGSNSKFTSFSVVGKFGLSQLDLEEGYPVTQGSGFGAFFAIGFGVYFW